MPNLGKLLMQVRQEIRRKQRTAPRRWELVANLVSCSALLVLFLLAIMEFGLYQMDKSR
jgi:hypothetical protein